MYQKEKLRGFIGQFCALFFVCFLIFPSFSSAFYVYEEPVSLVSQLDSSDVSVGVFGLNYAVQQLGTGLSGVPFSLTVAIDTYNTTDFNDSYAIVECYTDITYSVSCGQIISEDISETYLEALSNYQKHYLTYNFATGTVPFFNLDPDYYYTARWYVVRGSGSTLVKAYGTNNDSYLNGTSTGSSLSDYYFDLMVSPDNNTTRIISSYPTYGTQVMGTSTTVAVQYYNSVYSDFDTMRIYLSDLEHVSSEYSYRIYSQAITTGSNNLITFSTDDFLPYDDIESGKYRMSIYFNRGTTTRLMKEFDFNFNYSNFDTLATSTRTYEIASVCGWTDLACWISKLIDLVYDIYELGVNILQALRELGSVGLNVDFLPLGITGLNTIDPPSDSLVDVLQHKFPIGYITDINEIFATTSSTTIPVLSYTIPVGLVGANSNLTIDLNNSLDWFLYSTSTYLGTNETWYDILEYYWEIIVSLGAGLYILRRVFGNSLIPSAYGQGTADRVVLKGKKR